MLEADYVIVGAGSAGCALAYRLSEDGKHSVLVLEFGGTDFGPLIQMPAAFSIPMNMKSYDWGFRTEPEPHLNGRRLATPRGKVIGGSSSINGMVFVRGHAQDFDRWEEAGSRGWGFRDVLPYFKRMETAHGGEEGWRGTDGPLHVTRGTRSNPLYRAFTDAGVEAGYGFTDDYNGSRQEGFGPMEMTVWKGRRWSAANAYLKPALKRPNVQLRTGIHAERIAFEGRRAVGVVVRRWGKLETIRARKEVILSASSINSPKLLMLSGIGPAEHLREHGIEVLANRPGVGANLQDHLEVYVQQACTRPITLNAHLGLLARGRIGLRWMASRNRARRLEPLRGLRLHPLRRGRALSGPADAFPAGGGALRRTGGGDGAWLPGACRADALALARHRAAEIRGAARGAGDQVQLHEPRRGLARFPQSHPADAGDLCAAGALLILRRRDRAGQSRAVGCSRSTTSCATTSRAPTIPAGLAAWARSTT